MPSFRTGSVVEITAARPGLQRVLVAIDGGQERAYVLTQLVGAVEAGDAVVVNTTAVALGLGTGGWHVVHCNLTRPEFDEPGPGHVMKLRYTSLQSDVGSTEEHAPELAQVIDIRGLPVVAVGLHSQLAGVAVAIKMIEPHARVAYVMTDAAALPLALSDLVWNLRERKIIDTTVTAGHAFGGDHEAVSLHSALAIADRIASVDVAIVGMGPGVVGTGSALGYSGIEVGGVIDTVVGLGGTPIACVRASDADERDRHRGLSHHAATALTVGCRSRAMVALPRVGGPAEAELRAGLSASGVVGRHDIVVMDPVDIIERFAELDLDVRSMGRRAPDDPLLHACAAAAGTLAAAHIRPRP